MDDGFEWIERLEPSVSRQLHHLIDLVADGEHGAVDALVPSIVGLAREHGNAWIEVFARNFELRSLILHREDTRAGMAKAIALLDRAHEPDTIDCPQSICTAHAVCAAYGFRDPEGFTDERLRVSAETLSRTDPRRICWICITNEHADALIDAGRAEEALAYLDQNEAKRLDAGAPVDPDDFGLRRAHALLRMGRPEDALAALEAAACTYRGHSWQRTWRQWRARMRAEMGQHAAAVEDLSSPEDVLQDGGFGLHFETLRRLYGSGAMDDDALLAQVCRVGREGAARGVARASLDALAWAAARLVEQHEPTLAAAVVEVARGTLEDLADATSARATLDALEAQIAALPPIQVEPTPQNFEAALQVAAGGGEPALTRAAAACWIGFGFPEKGRALLVQAYAEAPGDALFDGLARTFVEAGDWAGLESLLENPSPEADGAALALSYRAEMLHQTEGEAAIIEPLRALLAARPDWGAAIVPLGVALFNAGRLREAADHWAAAAAAEESPNRFDFDLLACATALEDWATVREVARRVGFEVEAGDEPLLGDFGHVAVDIPGVPRLLRARRLSPALVEVMSIIAPGMQQCVGDRVLIHPYPDNVDELGPDGPPPRHSALATLSEAGLEAVALDGQRLSEKAADKLWDRLVDAGFRVQNSAGNDYYVFDPDKDERVPGMYWLVALERDQAEGLLTLFESIKGPGVRVWHELLALVGRHDEANAHLETAREWGMV